MLFSIIRIFFVYSFSWKNIHCSYSETDGRYHLDYLNRQCEKRANEIALAEWEYQNDMRNETFIRKLQVQVDFANFTRHQWNETLKYPWRTYRDPLVRKQFKEFSLIGAAALSDEKYEAYERIITEMEGMYTRARVCSFHDPDKCDLAIEPDIINIMANSRDELELRHIWLSWADNAGRHVRSLYPPYVFLSNEAATLNNFTDAAEYWISGYETKNFREKIENLWQQVRPLYLQLHAYVRRKLREFYGEEKISKHGPIPAHLLGDMWAQSWLNIADLTIPFPNIEKENITQALIKKKYNPDRMFRLADNFFKSLGLLAVPDVFWEKSILEKIPDREMLCHASAWDFADGQDFRIRQCTEVTEENLYTAHHEMGHLQYFMQYRHLPIALRGAANPAFHEAIGDIIGLSVSTPKHMHKIGILDNYTDSHEANLNFLLKMALEKIAFLPFGYLLDLWRWNVFKGNITKYEYNEKWWKLRTSYQGVKPPMPREQSDFDPGTKYHIVGSVPYIRQVRCDDLEALCKLAGQYDPSDQAKPLHKCDLYGSTVAGERLGKMLRLGASKPWPEAMKIITGQEDMNADSLLRYFAPINDWLIKENRRTNEFIGWREEA